MQISYYLVSEMQKSMSQDFQDYFFTGVVLNWDTTFLTEATVTHNRKKYFSKFFFTSKISFHCQIY